MEPNALYFVLTLAVTILSAWIFISGRRNADVAISNGCKPPPAFPQSRWLLGLDVFLLFLNLMNEGSWLEEASRWFQDIGQTFSISIFGSTRIWTVQPENVKTILQVRSEDYELSWIRIKAFKPYLGSAPQASNGDLWAHGRALLRPSFKRSQVTNLDLYEEHFQKLVELIPDDGSTIDLQKLFQRLTIDVASEFLFGQSVNTLQRVVSKETQELEAAMEEATMGLVTRFNMGNLIHFYWRPSFYRAVKYVHNYVQKFVLRALEYRQTHYLTENGEENEQSNKRLIFIEALAQYTGDRKMLQDQVMGVLMGSRSSTASLLSNLFYLLARHPEAEKKLRAEVAQLNGEIPTYEQLKRMDYLKHVMDETLRYYPSAPINERAAIRDTVLPLGGGPDGTAPVYVRKGQPVLYHTYAMHRSTNLWGPDAGEFKPERWEELEGRVGWRFTPFGGGGRICPGQGLALAETMFFVTRILQNFSKLENRDDKPFVENVGVVFTVHCGVLVSLSR